MTAQCPNCGTTGPDVKTFTADPDMGGDDTLDCNNCGASYVFQRGNWVRR